VHNGSPTVVAADALTMQACEADRIAKMEAMVATGPFCGLTFRGLIRPLALHLHARSGPVEAIGAILPAGSWGVVGPRDAANLMTVTPKSHWGFVKSLLFAADDGHLHEVEVEVTVEGVRPGVLWADPAKGRDGRDEADGIRPACGALLSRSPRQSGSAVVLSRLPSRGTGGLTGASGLLLHRAEPSTKLHCASHWE